MKLFSESEFAQSSTVEEKKLPNFELYKSKNGKIYYLGEEKAFTKYNGLNKRERI